MIRIALLDTTIPNTPSSMARYRDQLVSAFANHADQQIEAEVVHLGCDHAAMENVPRRFRTWYRHFHIYRSAKRADLKRFDVVHLLDGSFGYVVDAVRHPRVLVTVHDIIPRLQMDGHFSGAPEVGKPARWLIRRALRGVGNASLICSVSQNTANDLRKYGCSPKLGIRVVPSAVEPDLFCGDESATTIQNANHATAPYLFHLGNNGFYKNRTGVIEVFRHVAPDSNARLVMAGPPPSDEIKQACDQSGFSDRIEFVINPNQAELSELYRGAAVFLFPSRYEGFGWPPLEAMTAGCPVVSSDAGSLPEVVGNAGIVIAGGEIEGMSTACKRLLNDPGETQRCVESGRRHAATFSIERLACAMSDLATTLTQSKS